MRMAAQQILLATQRPEGLGHFPRSRVQNFIQRMSVVLKLVFRPMQCGLRILQLALRALQLSLQLRQLLNERTLFVIPGKKCLRVILTQALHF